MKVLLSLTAIFLICMLLGYEYSLANPEYSKSFVEKTFSGFEFIKNMEHYEIFLFIFVNNSVKSFVSMLLGITFGLVPLLFLCLNGVLIGFVAGVSVTKFGILRTLLLLIPHGIFEIPAVLVSSAYGVEIGLATIKRVRGEEIDLNQVVLNKIRNFGRFLLPIFFIAALIETYITPAVASLWAF